MKVYVPLLLSLAVALPSLAAQPFRAVNRLFVYPLSADTFEVIEDRGVGARGIWCAAADYTKAAGLDGARKRMYILEPRGPSKTVQGRMGVVYTLNPDDALRNTPTSYSVSVKRVGENLPVGHAYLFCEAFIEELFDRF
ncbi:hypothetical protein ACOTTU_01435 [Roseobacter sp. EG26]|uniref:hypothetical protein n=1 Tax=Roseobacter sp. EG26 TaxID=3412477 RepID=UPI003CE4A268